MTSRHVIMGCVTSTGCLVMRFMSQSRQPSFANNVTGTHALTVSRVSITKAGGLSDALGAERSPNGEDGDTVTHSSRVQLSSFYRDWHDLSRKIKQVSNVNLISRVLQYLELLHISETIHHKNFQE